MAGPGQVQMTLDEKKKAALSKVEAAGNNYIQKPTFSNYSKYKDANEIAKKMQLDKNESERLSTIQTRVQATNDMQWLVNPKNKNPIKGWGEIADHRVMNAVYENSFKEAWLNLDKEDKKEGKNQLDKVISFQDTWNKLSTEDQDKLLAIGTKPAANVQAKPEAKVQAKPTKVPKEPEKSITGNEITDKGSIGLAQTYLIEFYAHYLKKPIDIAVNGTMDTKTRSVLKDYQSRRFLEPNGRLTKRTFNSLQSDYNGLTKDKEAETKEQRRIARLHVDTLAELLSGEFGTYSINSNWTAVMKVLAQDITSSARKGNPYRSDYLEAFTGAFLSAKGNRNNHLDKLDYDHENIDELVTKLTGTKGIATIIDQVTSNLTTSRNRLTQDIKDRPSDTNSIQTEIKTTEQLIKQLKDLENDFDGDIAKRVLSPYYSDWYSMDIDSKDIEGYTNERNVGLKLEKSNETFKFTEGDFYTLKLTKLLKSYDRFNKEKLEFLQSIRSVASVQSQAATENITAAEQGINNNAQLSNNTVIFNSLTELSKQKVIDAMNSKYGPNWYNFTGQSTTTIQSIVQDFSTFVSSYQSQQTTVTGDAVANSFVLLSFETQYQLLELIKEQYGGVVVTADDVQKVGVLVNSVLPTPQGIRPGYAPLLLKEIGGELLNHNPTELELVANAIVGYSGVFYDGSTDQLNAYYKSLPSKLQKLGIDLTGLKDEPKIGGGSAKDIRIQTPEENAQYAAAYGIAGNINARFPIPIYAALFQNQLQPIFVTRPPNLSQGQAAAPQIFQVKQSAFKDKLITLSNSRAVSLISVPYALSNITVLAPNKLPNVGGFKTLLLRLNNSYSINNQYGMDTKNITLSANAGQTSPSGHAWGATYTETDATVDQNGTVTSGTVSRTGNVTLTKQPIQDSPIFGGGLLNIQGNMQETTGLAVSKNEQITTALNLLGRGNSDTVNNSATNPEERGGADTAVYFTKQIAAGQLVTYNANIYRRNEDGTFYLADVVKLTPADAQTLYNTVFSETEKEYARIHPTAQITTDLEGAVLLVGGKRELQGIGGAFGTEKSGIYSLFEKTRGERFMVGIGSSDAFSVNNKDRGFWTGRLYVSDIEPTLAQTSTNEVSVNQNQTLSQIKQAWTFEGWALRNAASELRFFVSERGNFENSAAGLIYRAVTKSNNRWGGTALYEQVPSQLEEGASVYFIRPTVTNYIVASYLMEQLRQGTLTTSSSPANKVEVGALGLNWVLGETNAVVKGIGISDIVNSNQSVTGGAVEVSQDKFDRWDFRSASAIGGAFELQEDVKKQTEGFVGLRTTGEKGRFSSEAYFFPGVLNLHYDVPAVSAVLGGGGLNLIDDVYGFHAGVEPRLGSSEWPVVVSAEVRTQPRTPTTPASTTGYGANLESRTVSALAGWTYNWSPADIANAKRQVGFALSSIVQRPDTGAQAHQVDVSATYGLTSASTTRALTASLFEWNYYVPTNIVLQQGGKQRDQRVGLNLSYQSRDTAGGKILMWNWDLPTSVIASITTFGSNQSFVGTGNISSLNIAFSGQVQVSFGGTQTPTVQTAH